MSWSTNRTSWPICDSSQRVCTALRTDRHLVHVSVRSDEVCPSGHIVRGPIVVECPLLHRAVNLSQIINASIGGRRGPSPYKLSNAPCDHKKNGQGCN